MFTKYTLLFTGMPVHHCLAALTFDLAAPDELTEASLHVSHHLRVVASSTAQQLTTVRAIGVFIALAPPGAGDRFAQVFPAVVWRPVHVNHLQLLNRDSSGAFLSPPELAFRPRGQLRGHVVFVFQHLTNLPEGRHAPPTCLDCAGARDAMTTALELHRSRHNL